MHLTISILIDWKNRVFIYDFVIGIITSYATKWTSLREALVIINNNINNTSKSLRFGRSIAKKNVVVSTCERFYTAQCGKY